MVPVPVILCEFLVAFGLALFGANAVAFAKLRRAGNWPPDRPATVTPAPRGRKAVSDTPLPSRTRILAGIVVGLLVTLWAIATFVSEGYSL
ncbi:MAG TPA: hypothetical protein VNB94_01605 [Mycobacteriales bacterium]|nr:hypothetical protein [Mycobacteriales bacterium]